MEKAGCLGLEFWVVFISPLQFLIEIFEARH